MTPTDRLLKAAERERRHLPCPACKVGLACPACKVGRLSIITDGTIGRRSAPFAACNRCEFCSEVRITFVRPMSRK